MIAQAAPTEAPHIDWAAISPLVALAGGLCLVLMVGLLRPPFARHALVPFLSLVTLGAAAGLGVWQWGENKTVISDALAIDDLTLSLLMVFCAGGIAAQLLSWRGSAAREAGHGEYHALLLCAVLGMVVLVGSQNLVAVFLGYELLSIPLYVLCATHLRREQSLESGLKYLIIGSAGSAILLYGMALVYGATGTTDFAGIAAAVSAEDLRGDVLFLTALALTMTGFAFKASVAPFHQWTPDVYEGAPTPVTAFMAVATKAAALGATLRFFDVAVIGASDAWAPALAALALVSIVVGNVGALGQSSLKRLLAWSSIAQAGYMLAGVVVSTRVGVEAVVFYLFAYALMTLAAFAVIVARERETGLGDDIAAIRGIGVDRAVLAWPMTIAMLSLAGLPVTMGFFGKITLIGAAVDNDWAWLAVAIVIGSAISLAYYLRVIAAVWMRAPEDDVEEAGPLPVMIGGHPIIAGGAPEADRLVARPDPPAAAAAETVRAQPEVVFVAVVCAVATLGFGIYPEPLLDVARDAGAALTNLL